MTLYVRHRPFARLLILITLTLLMLLGMLLPLIEKSRSTVSSFFETRRKYQESTLWEKNKSLIERQNRSFKKAVARVKLGGSKEKQLSLFYSIINEAAQKSNVSFTTIKPGAETEDREEVRMPFEMATQSNFHSIGKFLRYIENDGTLFKVQELSMVANRLDKPDVKVTLKLEFLVLK